VIEYCKIPDYIQVVEKKDIKVFLINKRIQYNKQDRLLLARIIKQEDKDYRICFYAVIRKEKFHYYYDNPVRMFLLFLDIYGLFIRIGKKEQKYFYEYKVPIEQIDMTKIIQIENQPKQGIVSLVLKKGRNKIHIFDAFGINFTQYMSDFKNARV
jgi:hypothetical protein